MFVKHSRPLLRPLLRPLAFGFARAADAPAAHAAHVVNLYTTRAPKLIQPLDDAVTKQRGIADNT
ncbi:iron ABC transporter substrate-binding protein, partial [Burkholderia pseudomallei]